MILCFNKSASFLVKNGFFVVYYNYNFYFFKKEPKKWLELILSGKSKTIPLDFIEYLKDRNLIV